MKNYKFEGDRAYKYSRGKMQREAGKNISKLLDKISEKKVTPLLAIGMAKDNEREYVFTASRDASPIDIYWGITEYLKDDFLEYKTREGAEVALNNMVTDIRGYLDNVMGEPDEAKVAKEQHERSRKMVYKIWKEQCDAELPRAVKMIQGGEDYVSVAKERISVPIVLWVNEEACKQIAEDNRELARENEELKSALEQDKNFKDSQIEALKATNSMLNKEIAKLDHRLKEMEEANIWGESQK